jgi:RecJ-like exonuclease
MKNGEMNAVKVFPEIKEEAVSKSQQKFMAMVCQVKKGKMKAPSAEVAKAAKGMSEKDACDFAGTKHEGLPEKVSEEAVCPKCGKNPCECDTRANQTYRDLLKNKLRSMGKKVIAACGDEENLEKSYDDMMTASFVKPNKETGKLEPVHVFKKVSAEGYDSTYGRGERGEPKGTQYLKVDKDKFNKDMEFWRNRLPKPGSNQVKGA